MNFQEALHEVITNGVVAYHRSYYCEDDHDRPYPDRSSATPWSIWMRIRLWDSDYDEEALVFFESNNYDETTGKWLLEWNEDQLSRADILAEDWEIKEEW